MSRRARSRAAAIEAKRAFAWTPAVHDCGPEDEDDEGGIDAEPCPHCRGDGMDPDCDYLLPCPDCGAPL